MLSSSGLTPAQQLVYQCTRERQGQAFADRLLTGWSVDCAVGESPKVEDPLEHPSHQRATELLAPYRAALGPAYPTLHVIARWSVEHAAETDPAPHLLTTYWTLSEITGRCERTLIRHLVESGHPWSETVEKLIDVHHNYGERRQGDQLVPCITGTVIRFFPEGRKSKNARVKKWHQRDLSKEAEAGRTKRTRHHQNTRYRRMKPRMSAYRPVTEQAREHNWLMVPVGRAVATKLEPNLSGNLYTDIPANQLLNALRADLTIVTEQTQQRGGNVGVARAKWVETAASVLARRFGDDLPPLPFLGTGDYSLDDIIGYQRSKRGIHPIYASGFTNLWRKLLWTALRAELYGGTAWGWTLLERLCVQAREAEELGKHKPVAWAWALTKREGFEELLRDYGRAALADRTGKRPPSGAPA